MVGAYNESELPEQHSELGDFGELPEDLRILGPNSIRMPGSPGLFEADAYAKYGAKRDEISPVPPSETPPTTGISILPRQNFESFWSQRLYIPGPPTILAPSSGVTFTSLARYQIPGGFAAVITGLGQFTPDSSAYNKADGTPDDITWQIALSSTPAFDYSNINQIISTLVEEGKLYLVVVENTIVELLATNNLIVGSFGARNIAVSGYLTGHQFPMDEIDDVFRNR